MKLMGQNANLRIIIVDAADTEKRYVFKNSKIEFID